MNNEIAVLLKCGDFFVFKYSVKLKTEIKTRCMYMLIIETNNNIWYTGIR